MGVATLPDDLAYWVAFSRVPSVGRVRVGLLEQRFGSLRAAWEAGAGEFRSAGLDQTVVNAIAGVRARTDPAQEFARVRDAGVQAWTWHDSAYPRLLRQVDDLPPLLYAKGEVLAQDERAITVVGTRKPTAYGREAAAHLARDLARAGVTVVSGLARGVDGIAHRAVLEAGGRTIAVLGSGLDVIYPPEHADLARSVAEHGALLSEHPLGTRPDARHFPRRNRLLSGLSLGVLVIEAAEGSGTLSTVRYALEQGRDVFCVPGSIYSESSRVTNMLIREGAKLVMGVEDVLEELNLSATAAVQQPLPGLALEGQSEAALFKVLHMEPQHVDDLSRLAGMPVTEVLGALAVMEMKGLAKQVGRMNYIRVREASAAYGAAAP